MRKRLARLAAAILAGSLVAACVPTSDDGSSSRYCTNVAKCDMSSRNCYGRGVGAC